MTKPKSETTARRRVSNQVRHHADELRQSCPGGWALWPCSEGLVAAPRRRSNGLGLCGLSRGNSGGRYGSEAQAL